MTARSDAQALHERTFALVLELDADRCTNTYGSAPCTAAAGAGNECYNTFATCQDKANFTRGTVTHSFCTRGTVVPGQTVRPYITGNPATTPTEIVPSKGLAMRSQTQIQLLDEPAPDHLEDLYSGNRPYKNASFPQLTFTRASTATWFDATGRLRYAAVDEPRFDHDPVTGEALGLLVEGAATNIAYPSTPTAAGWFEVAGGTGVVAVYAENAAAAPDGSVTATRIVLDKGAGTAATDFSVTQPVITGTIVGAATSARVWMQSATDQNYVVQLNFGGVAADGGGDYSSIKTVTPVGGWYEIRLSAATLTTNVMRLSLQGGRGTSDYADIYVWGAHQENAQFCSSFIPTTTGSAAREGDVVQIASSDFSWNRSGGSYYVEYDLGDDTLVIPGSANDRRHLYYMRSSAGIAQGIISGYIDDEAGSIRSQAYDGVDSNSALSKTTGLISASGTNRAGVSYAYDETRYSHKICSNGVLGAWAANDPFTLSEPLNDFYIGSDSGVSRFLYGHIKRLRYYGNPLSDAELQTLTGGGEISATPALDLDFTASAYRTAPAGTWWGRFMARNTNLVGRPARVRRGYVQSPWTWDTFQTELFVIDAVRGPDEQGRVTVVLSDPLKTADRNTVPAPTAGALQAALPATADAGTAQAGGASTITLRADASTVDDAYNGQEVYLLTGTGAGQRRVISDYVGATRVATVSVAWGTQPDSTTTYEVAPLQLDVGSASADQYADPATSGKREFLRINDEVLEYTAKSGSVLSWADGSYRAQFGTTRASHDADDAVQLCRAWVAKRPWEVLRDLLTESGMDPAHLDLANWELEDDNYLNGSEITTVISEPEKGSDLVTELLRDINAVMWWSPVEQLVRMLVNQPSLTATPVDLTASELGEGGTKVERLDAERITQSALYYALRDATANVTEAKNYKAAAISIDLDAQSAEEYGDVRPHTAYSRWLGTANATFARSAVQRRVLRLRNAPMKVQCWVDPRNEVQLGDLVNLTTRRIVDVDGTPKTTKARVVRYQDKGARIELTALTVGYARSQYGFIAPNGLPNYSAASDDQRLYAFICNNTTNLMNNGDEGYFIS